MQFVARVTSADKRHARIFRPHYLSTYEEIAFIGEFQRSSERTGDGRGERGKTKREK